MKWHQYDEKERIKEVYSKFSIKDFFDWWQDGEEKVMEVRIKDFALIKETAHKFYLPYSASGVYVKTVDELKEVIGYVRKDTTVWFGIQPRKKNWNAWGNKSYGGKDVNVQEMKYLFIDIDRQEKTKSANKTELANCDALANNILDSLSIEGWNKSYIKVCSGNGVQLILKLDFPIKLSEITFDNQSKTFIMNDEFDIMKQLISKGIGNEIVKFSRKHKELKVEVDKACFKLSQVGALHCTKNHKYGGFTWRGIVEMKDEENTGLSDYILSKIEDLKKFRQQNVFVKSRAKLPKNRLQKGKLKEHKLIKFMLECEALRDDITIKDIKKQIRKKDYERQILTEEDKKEIDMKAEKIYKKENYKFNISKIPEGQRNNYLWCQLKCLLRDNKIDLRSKEWQEIHRQLQIAWGDELNLNLPEENISFKEDTINSFCINNCIPPLYKLWSKRTKHLDMKFEDMQFVTKCNPRDKIVLKEETTIQEDMWEFKVNLIEGDYNNRVLVGAFTVACIEKYGIKKAKYYFDNVFERAFSWE